MPFVAPATWTNRRRRVAGSCQVRLRQVTGMPEPEQRDERPARDEVADEGAVGVAPDRTDRE